MSGKMSFEPVQRISITASEEIPANRFVGYDGKLCAEGKKAVGISEYNSNNAEQATIITAGTMLLKISEAVTALGAAIASDSVGMGVPADVFSVGMTLGSINVTADDSNPDFLLQGSVLPEFINAFSMETGINGDIIKVNLV